MNIYRHYQNLDKYIEPNKVLVIYGARQIGKTTLISNYLKSTKYNYRLETGDNLRISNLFESLDFNELIEFASNFELIVIDEAQKIPNIGHGLKILVDNIKNIKIIVTGSASFELAGQVGEPLTGRKTTLTLFPIAQLELLKDNNKFDLHNELENYLLYGSYPEIITQNSKKKKISKITELTDSYLLKDILELEKVKSSKVLLDLLKLIAFQIGSEVSLSELASKVGLDYKTVARYLDLFEKSFILYNLRGYSRNLRKELTRKSKYYFLDLGIRNAIISNFNSLDNRNDIGGLWENFLIIERLKKQNYKNILSNNYFWRTWDQQELDWIEEREGSLFAYEFKFSKNKVTLPKLWSETYPNSSTEIINKKNYFNFIT